MAADQPIWEFEHSVECGAPREFAWKYWTNPANWDDLPARFEFSGPFVAGTKLKTILPGQKLESVIREVEEGCAARIEMEVMGAVVRFGWRFEQWRGRRTRITQQISLSGSGARAMVEQARMLNETVPDGMAKLAKKIERNWVEKGFDEGTLS